MRIFAPLIPALWLAACLPSADRPRADAQPKLDPIAFFAGYTEGRGALHKLVGNSQPLSVSSVGRKLPGGGLRLDQLLHLEGEAVRERRWTIWPMGKGRFTGSLTEAVGPVEAAVQGNRMTIRYATEDYRVRQTLTLGMDGIVHNRLDIYKWGLNVARLDERIARKSPAT
ncbi:DUF3833 family protein [Sphingomonas xanthus]|uniref:DUF3833 family protein n=1 Tax=Sphingomonas xanthus TaxID=2594473 RepID=UPI00164E34FC|nr:DUF3833 family protein [Sphingomonas xanthus]